MAEIRRRPASPQELLAEFFLDIELLAAPSSVQQEWLDQHGYPVVELALQFYDARVVSTDRLEQHGLLDDQDRIVLDSLEQYLVAIPGYVDDFEWLRTAPAWIEIRRLAGVALESLERHRS
jgi:hypothetical protein